MGLGKEPTKEGRNGAQKADEKLEAREKELEAREKELESIKKHYTQVWNSQTQKINLIFTIKNKKRELLQWEPTTFEKQPPQF